MAKVSIVVPAKVFSAVYGSVASDWRQHENGGGWIYKTAHVDESVYLHPTSIVYGNAQVYGNAWVSGNAQAEELVRRNKEAVK